MRAAVALLIVAAGCRSDDSLATREMSVTTYAGSQVAPGTRVIAHRPTGEVIDETVTDGIGTATLGITDDAYLSALFGDVLLTGPMQAEIDGPAVESSNSLVVGTVAVDAPALTDATSYSVDLGCVTLTTTTFPRTFNVTACSLGSDSDLDILVRAFHDATFLAYEVLHVPLVDEHAVAQVAAWNTTGTQVPIDAPVGTDFAIRFVVDGNSYDAPPVVGPSYTGYWSDPPAESHIHAVLDTRTFDIDAPGYPTVTIASDSLLPAIAPSLARTDNLFTWAAPTFAADTVDVIARTPVLVWHASLPADVTQAAVPDTMSLDATDDVELAFSTGGAATHAYGYP